AVGEISYDEAALLKLGVSDEPYDGFNQTELHLIDKKQLMEGEPDVSVVEMEALHLAKTIKHWVESEQLIYHRKTGKTAPIRYQDIVILMRSLTNVTVFQDVFRQYDIPLFTEQNTDLFDSIEIINVLAMLKVIDNPYQDIPLVGLMRSPLFFFSEHDLAQIRLSAKGTYFYEAVLSYERDGENELLRTKVVHFVELIERFRYLSKTIALSQLIRMIYEETMYYDFVMGLPHGYLRKANLDVFHDKALAYETLTKKGVFGFVTYIERMQTLGKHFGKAKTVTANENVVRIMSIHKSKGLEFPIVFISQIHKKFNEKDEMGNYILHKKYGIAVKYIDPILRLKQKTVAQSMVAQKIHQEMIAEEMRLLYVAMTRAKSKIIFTGVFDVEKKVQGLSDIVRSPDWLLPSAYRVKSKSYADWIIPAVLRQPSVDEEILAFIEDKRSILQDESHWKVLVIDHYDVDICNDLDSGEEQLLPKEIDLDKIFNPNYEFQSLVQINAKQSVSQRKVEETTPLFKGIPQATSSIAYDRPSFMQDKKMSGAQIGTALHNFMQHLPLSSEHNLETLVEVKDELVRKEILSEKVSESIDLTSILQFTRSVLYQELLKAHAVKKEVPFMTLIQLKKQDQSKILLQGVIDLLAEFDSEVWIVDYKTDYVKNFVTQYDELKTRYEIQMKYYAKAISEIYPRKKVKCCVYFLKVQEMITYEMTEFNN
ncbi:MAG: 3'-5' exonuclease, partial [Turicibacter sp.]